MVFGFKFVVIAHPTLHRFPNAMEYIISVSQINFFFLGQSELPYIPCQF